MQAILTRSGEAQKELLQISQQLREGVVPSVYEVLALYGELSDLYWEVNNHISTAYSAKEKSYLARKIGEANKTRELRASHSQGDSKHLAIVATVKELYEEVDRATEYEQWRLLSRSLQNACDFIRSLKTSVERAETNPS